MEAQKEKRKEGFICCILKHSVWVFLCNIIAKWIFSYFLYGFEVLWSWSYKYVQGDQTAKKEKHTLSWDFKIYMPIIWHWWMGLSSSLQAVMWLGYSIPSIYRVAFHNIHRLVHKYTEVYWGKLYDGFGWPSPSKETSKNKQIEKYQMQNHDRKHIKLLCVSLCTELAYNLTGINIWSLN